MTDPLNLDPRLAAIHAAEYPRFSEAEMARRRALLVRAMEKAGVDHLLVCGEQRSGTGVAWLTSWPATVEACDRRSAELRSYVEWYNHWPLPELARQRGARGAPGYGQRIADQGTRRGVGLMGALGAKCGKPGAFGRWSI
jgi:hypothetical protein